MGAAIGAVTGDAILGGGTGLVNTLIGVRTNNYNTHAQEEMASVNRDWQTVEAEKARQFNKDERIAAQEFSEQMLDKQNAYSTPLMQAARLRDAGVNPQIAMGSSVQNVSASSLSPSSGNGSPMPAQVQGLSPAAQPPEINLANIGSFLSGIANAKKAGVETSYLEKSMDLNLKGLQADVGLKELLSKGQQLDNAFKSHTMPARVEHAYESLRKAVFDTVIAEQSGYEIKAKTDLDKALTDFYKASEGLTNTSQQLAVLDVKTYMDRFNTWLRTQKSEQSKNYGLANEANTQAAVNGVVKKLREGELRFQDERLRVELRGLKTQNLISDAQLAQAEAIAEQAKYAADNKEILFWKDLFVDIISSATDVAGAFARLKSAKAWLSMSDSSRKNVERKIEQMEWEYGDKVTIDDKLPSGAKRSRTYRRKGAKFGDS